MGRYTYIATRNDATGRFDTGETALETATSLGMTIYTSTWADNYTAAYGRQFAVRTKHFKRLPSKVRATTVPR